MKIEHLVQSLIFLSFAFLFTSCSIQIWPNDNPYDPNYSFDQNPKVFDLAELKDAYTIQLGEKLDVDIRIYPNNVKSAKLNWSSSSTDIVSVEELAVALRNVPPDSKPGVTYSWTVLGLFDTARLTGHVVGTANLTISTTDGSNIVRTATVTVTP
jgi:hypothetical protein